MIGRDILRSDTELEVAHHIDQADEARELEATTIEEAIIGTMDMLMVVNPALTVVGMQEVGIQRTSQ